MLVLFVFVEHKSPETIDAVFSNEKNAGERQWETGGRLVKCDLKGRVDEIGRVGGRQTADGNWIAHTSTASMLWDTVSNLYISLHMIPFFAFQLLRYHFR